MKRGILVLLFILLLACSVNAMTVSINDPGSPLAGSVGIVMPISDIGEGENVKSISLYYRNGTEDVWYLINSDSNENQTSYTISFDTTQFVDTAAGYLNATAINNSEGSEIVEATLRQITIDNIVDTDGIYPECSQSDTNITVNEDSGSWTLDSNMSLITNNISCTDANALTYTISSQTGSGGTFSLSSNDVLNFATDANATGTKIVVIGVSDGTNTIHVSAQVIVSAVNDPPYLSSVIDNQTWNQNTNEQISLSEHFSDLDDSSLNYSYDFTSSSPFNINVTIEDDGDAVLTPETDWSGSETITFTAYDAANLSFTSNEIILTVEATNTTGTNKAPVINTKDPTTDPTISVGGSQIFKITKSDPDGDPMNVTWYVDGVSREGETGDSFTYKSSIVGSFVIKVAVTDGKLSDTEYWALTVKSAQTTNQTASSADKKTGEDVTACGDGTCSDDEDQFSCCKDCGCPESYTCNEDTGKCTKERKSGNIILLAVVLGLFVGGAGVGLYIYKKKQEQEIFGGLANAPISLPPKVGEVKKEGVIIKKPQEPVKKAEKVKEKPLKDTKTTSQVLLKSFIITNIKKGKSLEEIKAELRKVGWTEEQINDAYTAAQLDEAFS